jgi:uracil-DNA glycosylase family 4
LRILHDEIVRCRKCARLVAWCEKVARTKRRKYAGEKYWGRPVPGFGDPNARLLVVGLAPGAHGANRTGRVFTGDKSGDFLYAALHRAGFANQAESTSRDDGLELRGAYVVTAIRCAPPGNAPAPDELKSCAPFLGREVALLEHVRVVLALGSIAWNAWLDHTARSGVALPRPRPRFSHGAELALPQSPLVLGSYHVSQQNTQTGKLTAEMFDAVVAEAARNAYR